MSLLSRVLGPESKYDRRLPYSYVARIAVTGVPGMTQSYVCDTLCGLLERLERRHPVGVLKRNHNHVHPPQGLAAPAGCSQFPHQAEGRIRA